MPRHLHYKRYFYRFFYRANAFEILSRLRTYVGSAAAQRIARLISYIYTTMHPEVLDVVCNNLSLLQPAPVARKSARRVFQNFSEVLADYFAMYHQSPAEAARMCAKRQGEEILRAVHQSGSGAILATAHFGFFELGSALLAELGIPFTILTLPESTDAMTAWRTKVRAKWNIESLIIGTDPFASLEAVRRLQQGHFLAMLIDRPLNQRSICIDTPGGHIPFSLAAALLSHLAQCPIIPVAIWKTGKVYQMHTHEAICVPSQQTGVADRQLAFEKATRQVAHCLLQNIIQAPDQWYQFAPVNS